MLRDHVPHHSKNGGTFVSQPLHTVVPDFQGAQLSSADLTNVVPTEYRADAVVRLDSDGMPMMAIVIEVQLETATDKRLTWPVYVTTLRARLDCPAMLLVVCPSQRVADWCAEPIEIGPPGMVLTPLVLGPRQIPIVTDIDVARLASVWRMS